MDEATEYITIENALKEKKYLIEGRLGKGAYGQVYQAKYEVDKQVYAIKIIPVEENRVKYQKRELDALIKLNHLQEPKRYFIKYYKSWLLEVGNEKRLCIKMEMCSGDLRTFVYKNRNFAPHKTQTIPGPRFYQHVFQQILNGLAVIHSIGWVHRDIHPGNILVVNSNPKRISDIRVKIGDFGLAKKMGIELEISPGLTLHPRPEQSTDGLAGFYTAPELSTKRYNERIDLYSAGILLYFISRYPKNEDEWMGELKNLVQGKLNVHECLFYRDDHKLVALITNLLKRNPNERPSAYDAKKYMFPETQDTTDGNEAQETRFYVRKENEQDLRGCYLNIFTFSSLKAEVERRTGVRQGQLRQLDTINGIEERVMIENDEDVEGIFQEAKRQKRRVVIVVIEQEDDNISTGNGQISSGDVTMDSVDFFSSK